MTRDYDQSFSAVDAMPLGLEKAIQWAVYGLTTDGSHHKQWFLEQILIALGVDLDEPREWLEEDGYGGWEQGIAP